MDREGWGWRKIEGGGSTATVAFLKVITIV